MFVVRFTKNDSLNQVIIGEIIVSPKNIAPIINSVVIRVFSSKIPTVKSVLLSMITLNKNFWISNLHLRKIDRRTMINAKYLYFFSRLR